MTKIRFVGLTNVKKAGRFTTRPYILYIKISLIRFNRNGNEIHYVANTVMEVEERTIKSEMMIAQIMLAQLEMDIGMVINMVTEMDTLIETIKAVEMDMVSEMVIATETSTILRITMEMITEMVKITEMIMPITIEMTVLMETLMEVMQEIKRWTSLSVGSFVQLNEIKQQYIDCLVAEYE